MGRSQSTIQHIVLMTFRALWLMRSLLSRKVFTGSKARSFPLSLFTPPGNLFISAVPVAWTRIGSTVKTARVSHFSCHAFRRLLMMILGRLGQGPGKTWPHATQIKPSYANGALAWGRTSVDPHLGQIRSSLIDFSPRPAMMTIQALVEPSTHHATEHQPRQLVAPILADDLDVQGSAATTPGHF